MPYLTDYKNCIFKHSKSCLLDDDDDDDKHEDHESAFGMIALQSSIKGSISYIRTC
jgi:hypothetical protein